MNWFGRKNTIRSAVNDSIRHPDYVGESLSHLTREVSRDGTNASLSHEIDPTKECAGPDFGPRAALIRPHRDPAFAAASFGRVNILSALSSSALQQRVLSPTGMDYPIVGALIKWFHFLASLSLNRIGMASRTDTALPRCLPGSNESFITASTAALSRTSPALRATIGSLGEPLGRMTT